MGYLVAEEVTDADTLDEYRNAAAFDCGGGSGVLPFEPLPEGVAEVIDFDLDGVLLASVVEIPMFFKVSCRSSYVRLSRQCSAFREFLSDVTTVGHGRPALQMVWHQN